MTSVFLLERFIRPETDLEATEGSDKTKETLRWNADCACCSAPKFIFGLSFLWLIGCKPLLHEVVTKVQITLLKAPWLPQQKQWRGGWRFGEVHRGCDCTWLLAGSVIFEHRWVACLLRAVTWPHEVFGLCMSPQLSHRPRTAQSRWRWAVNTVWMPNFYLRPTN